MLIEKKTWDTTYSYLYYYTESPIDILLLKVKNKKLFDILIRHAVIKEVPLNDIIHRHNGGVVYVGSHSLSLLGKHIKKLYGE